MMVKIRHPIAAEEALEAAEKESRSRGTNPDRWSAFESVDRQGRRHSNVSESQFQRQAHADELVRARTAELLALRMRFAPCRCQHDGKVA